MEKRPIFTGESFKRVVPEKKSKARLYLERFSFGRLFFNFADIKFVRFLMVAALNTLFGWCVFSLLHLLVTDNRNIAALIGQIIGILFNFKTYGSIVFKNGKYYLLPRFIGVYAIMYFANIGGMAVLDYFFEISDYVNAAVMSIPVGFLGFALNKLFVFERSQEKQDHMQAKSESFWESFRKDRSKLVFYILCALGLVFMIAGSVGAGMSGDEHFHVPQAEHVYDFYKTLGKDAAAVTVTSDNNLPLYGQVVDNITYLFCRAFDIQDIMSVRHITNAFCGWLTIVFASLLVFRIAKRKYLPAILTFVLFFFSPRFLGHSFNDVKDISFLTFMTMGTFYIWVFCEDFPKVKASTMVMLAVSIGLATAVRVGGLLLIAYFGLFALIRYIVLSRGAGFGTWSNGKAFGKLLFYGVAVSLGGYVLGVLLWPYALVSPIKNVVGTFSEMSAFSVNIKQLFEGRMQWSSELPWYYTPKFIFMTVPGAVLAGALISLVTGWKKGRAFGTFFLLFCFAFPVFWIAYTGANVYGGWRHSMFCYSPLVAMAGLGFYSLYERFRHPALRWGMGVVLPLVLLAGPVRHCVANHPYEYVYFNELAGGIKNAYGKYELDYYYHSTRKATEWVLSHADTTALRPGQKYAVASWHTASVGYYINLLDSVHFRPTFSRIYQMGNNDWDYAVFTVTGMNPDWITNREVFPPVNTVHVEEVDGYPICIVLQRIDRNDLYGYRAMKEGKTDSAVAFFKAALQANPHNEQVLENLSEIYLNRNQPDSALLYAARWAKDVPSNVSALNLLANVYFQKNDISNALAVAERIIKLYPGDISGYWLAAHAYLRQNSQQGMQLALNRLQALVKIQAYAPAYQLMAQIYQAAGETAAARQCQNIASQLQQ